MLRFPFSLLFLLLFIGSTAIHATAQVDKDFPAELPEDLYGRTRSLGGGDITGGSEVFKFRKPVYRLKRRIPRPKRVETAARSKPVQTARYKLPSNPKAPEQWETIGLTVWRVQKGESKSTEGMDGASLLNQRTGELYTPIRANADTVFRLGEEVRFSIEAPREGYLYIIDREMMSGDQLGPPMQIFPTALSRGGNNLIRPGQLLDIPGQTDPPFVLRSSSPGYRGEMITVIFSPVELIDFETPRAPKSIEEDLVAEMEQRYLAEFGEYEQQGSVGTAYTKAEKEAGGTRQLTQADPQPQTRYRVKMRPREPMVINVGLNVQ